MGFDDGNLRVAVVNIDEKTNAITLTTIQVRYYNMSWAGKTL